VYDRVAGRVSCRSFLRSWLKKLVEGLEEKS
jgi:hypothetical protein